MRYLFFIFFLFSNINLYANEINLFTTRHYESDIELYKRFEKSSGIKVNIVTGASKPLEKRILEEGDSCIGDLLFLADAGRLYSAQEKGLFKKTKSENLKIIPSQFRSKYWFGITKRARIIYYNPDKTFSEEIENLTYESLADERFYNTIATRQSNNVYNQSLIASIIENRGAEYTKNG